RRAVGGQKRPTGGRRRGGGFERKGHVSPPPLPTAAGGYLKEAPGGGPPRQPCPCIPGPRWLSIWLSLLCCSGVSVWNSAASALACATVICAVKLPMVFAACSIAAVSFFCIAACRLWWAVRICSC